MPGSVNCSFIGRPDWQELTLAKIIPHSSAWYVLHGINSDFLKYYNGFFALLNQQEREQALRYYQLKDQQRYVIQHGIIRLMLAQFTGQQPNTLEFNYNATKKPYLPANACYFNLSHSGDEFLLSIGMQEMGIDLEYINPEFAYADIASHYFSREEEAFINNSSNPAEAFFLLWTRKEALLKACGTGIDEDLPAMPALNGKQQLPANYPSINWQTQSFYIKTSFIGSITYTKPEIELKFIDLSNEKIAILL